MHITLTGNLGSGKSTICRILESKYGYEIYSTGKVQRKLAEELGISVLEMNRRMCSDASYDHMIDDAVTRLSEENPEKKLVFDSRLAWHFAKQSFKVFLSVHIDEAARRVWNDKRGKVETYHSEEEAKQQLIARAQTEDQRYREIYGLEYFDFHNYNLVLDATFCSPDALAEQLLLELGQYCDKSGYYREHTSKLLLSPRRIQLPVDLNLSGQSPMPNAAYDSRPNAAYDSQPNAAHDSRPNAAPDLIHVRQDGFEFILSSGITAYQKALSDELPFIQVICN